MPDKKSVVDDIFDEIQKLKKEKEELEKSQTDGPTQQQSQDPADYFCEYPNTVNINGLEFPIVQPFIRRVMP